LSKFAIALIEILVCTLVEMKISPSELLILCEV
jgi:hypothetical protein